MSEFVTIDRATLEQIVVALEDSIDCVRHEYETYWGHGLPTRKAQIDSMKESLDQHESAITAGRAELAAIAATEPVLVVEKEPDYWSGGHFHEGSKSHIKSTKVWRLPVGTELFTRPMPAQDVTELVEALEELARLGNGEHYGNSDGNMIARTALSKYKGAK